MDDFKLTKDSTQVEIATDFQARLLAAGIGVDQAARACAHWVLCVAVYYGEDREDAEARVNTFKTWLDDNFPNYWDLRDEIKNARSQ